MYVRTTNVPTPPALCLGILVLRQKSLKKKKKRDVEITDHRKRKPGKQGRDDCIKQFTIQPHHIYLFTLRYIKQGCTLNCFMLSSLLCFLVFVFLFWYPYTLLHKSCNSCIWMDGRLQWK